MLIKFVHVAEAEAAFGRADERGDADGAVNLGMLLEARGDIPGATAAYRRAYERGHPELADIDPDALSDLIGDRLIASG
jgi:hypothetical protein